MPVHAIDEKIQKKKFNLYPHFQPKSVQDAEKTLRSLKSGSQPLVKKRQLMQAAFGDYRKKMAEEERKLRVGQCY